MQVNMKRSDDKTIVNLNLELLEDIKDQIIFKVSQYEKVDGQYQHFVNSSISACNVLGRFKAHPIMKLVVKELLKSSSIPTHCPIKKVSFQLHLKSKVSLLTSLSLDREFTT